MIAAVAEVPVAEVPAAAVLVAEAAGAAGPDAVAGAVEAVKKVAANF
ncbi:MAG: hypothetical protein M3285_00330 [Actinomycetota bacterium]|nr:hypothetical protein [Actinomycetota bacterium]